jgi:hypothetical protein
VVGPFFYEYFLSEFFTPRLVVRLMVEIIEPHHETVVDPACGSQPLQGCSRRLQGVFSVHPDLKTGDSHF